MIFRPLNTKLQDFRNEQHSQDLTQQIKDTNDKNIHAKMIKAKRERYICRYRTLILSKPYAKKVYFSPFMQKKHDSCMFLRNNA